MAFTLKKEDSFLWPATFELPVDGGTFEKQSFDVRYRRKPQSWIRQTAEAIDAEKTTAEAIAREVVIGWDGITDDDGEPVPFSTETLDQLLDVPTLASALVLEFFKASAGVKEGNS